MSINEVSQLTVLLSWALVTTVLAEDEAFWGTTLKVYGKLVPNTLLLFPSCHSHSGHTSSASTPSSRRHLFRFIGILVSPHVREEINCIADLRCYRFSPARALSIMVVAGDNCSLVIHNQPKTLVLIIGTLQLHLLSSLSMWYASL